MFQVKNASPAKKSKIIVKNAQNDEFVILVFFEKNIANVLLKNTTIDLKK